MLNENQIVKEWILTQEILDKLGCKLRSFNEPNVDTKFVQGTYSELESFVQKRNLRVSQNFEKLK